MKVTKALFLLFMSLVWLTPARAADVPSGLIVNAGGLEWAWASPCAPEAPSCGQSAPLAMHDGWSVATAEEFASSFTGFASLLAAFSTEQGLLCASAYFNSGWTHCDGADVGTINNLVWNSPAAWGATIPAYAYLSETFVVRGGEAPEPGTLALLALGLVTTGVTRRQRKA